ncbi:MAG: hypothetical protein H6509_09475 [Bryobacterales bacterium]|nr:hypothetical protein [Bryobacterales bacterium]
MRLIPILWAAPTSLVGLAIGSFALFTGGRLRRNAHTLEFYGGALHWITRLTPVRADAMALGHVIVAVDERSLSASRDHERVHVRQAEIFGPLFIPAYCLASAWAWASGRHYYFDNWFEVDARRRAPASSA